ncbi:hypothetical protein H1R20_g3673, partial [Candolleomyces eurysporus]
MATSTSAKSIATLPQQNVVELTSCVDSKIAGVSVYSHRAEVTRTFNFGLTSGQNQVEISGLPTLLIQDSLRVEGKEESDEIKPLRLKKLELEQAIERNDQSKDTLKMYMDSLTSPGAASFSKVVETTGEYDVAMTELQKKGNALAEDLEVVAKALSEKQRTLKDAAKTKWNEKLSLKVSVHILAEVEGEIELSLIYVKVKVKVKVELSRAGKLAMVSSLGDVSATFGVPGLTTIPSDGARHTVTIASLELDAKLCWVSVPKKDAKTYLSAKIQNASEYALLEGPANVYVDGSFIARSTIPAVNPEEKFECALGPALQLPNFSPPANAGPISPSDTGSVQSSGKGGLFRNIASSGNNSNSPSGTPSDKALKAVAKSVKVSPGVIAQWNRPDDLYSITGDASTEETKVHRSSESVSDSSEPLDLTALGKDGKISWLCSIPPQTKVNLTLHWEVSAPVNTDIVGI